MYRICIWDKVKIHFMEMIMSKTKVFFEIGIPCFYNTWMHTKYFSDI